MKRLFFLYLFCLLSLANNAQQSWLSAFNIFAGVGGGIGKYDNSLNQYNDINNRNHTIFDIAIDYQHKHLPFSIDYDFTTSNYRRKMGESKSISQYYIHKFGIGINFAENALFKIKCLANNQFNDIRSKKSLGLHTSIGVENNFLFGNLNQSKQLHFSYRLMLYYEHSFGDLSIDDQRSINLMNIPSPFRNVIGVALYLKPWLRKIPEKTPSNVLPPFK